MAHPNPNMATVTPILRMNQQFHTPESGSRSGAIITAAITPTLMLSEGPLTPSTPMLRKEAEFESMKLQLAQLSRLVESRLCPKEDPDEVEIGQLREALAASEAKNHEQSGQFIAIQEEYQAEIEMVKYELRQAKDKLVSEEIKRKEAEHEVVKLSKAKSVITKYFLSIGVQGQEKYTTFFSHPGKIQMTFF